MIHLLGSVLLATRLNVAASITSCVLSILAFDYYFISPTFAFAEATAKHWVTFAAMLIVTGVVSGLTQRLRRQKQAARAEAFRAETLYRLRAEFSSAGNTEQLIALAQAHFERLFAAKSRVLLTTTEGALGAGAWARSAFDTRQAVREPGNDRHATLWLPLPGAHRVMGVIALLAPPEQWAHNPALPLACAEELGATLERYQLTEFARRSRLEAETERLRSSLLSAVSHDLKTPLAAIIAAGTTLLGRRSNLETDEALELVATIVSESERLSRIIQNVLSITRLESPTIDLHRSPQSLEEILGEALNRLGLALVRERVHLELDEDLPLVHAEPALIEQVLVNLLENAARHSGTASSITVSAHTYQSSAVVRVSDDGAGISEREREKVFEKFYRGEHVGKRDGGIGLGLTICRAIVEAHGGQISISPRPRGGTVVEFTLPLAEMRPLAAAAHGAHIA